MCQSGFCQVTSSIQNNAHNCPPDATGKCKSSSCSCQSEKDVIVYTDDPAYAARTGATLRAVVSKAPNKKNNKTVGCRACANTRHAGEVSAKPCYALFVQGAVRAVSRRGVGVGAAAEAIGRKYVRRANPCQCHTPAIPPTPKPTAYFATIVLWRCLLQTHSIKHVKNLDDQLELRKLHWSFYPCIRLDSLTRFIERWDSMDDERPSSKL